MFKCWLGEMFAYQWYTKERELEDSCLIWRETVSNTYCCTVYIALNSLAYIKQSQKHGFIRLIRREHATQMVVQVQPEYRSSIEWESFIQN